MNRTPVVEEEGRPGTLHNPDRTGFRFPRSSYHNPRGEPVRRSRMNWGGTHTDHTLGSREACRASQIDTPTTIHWMIPLDRVRCYAYRQHEGGFLEISHRGIAERAEQCDEDTAIPISWTKRDVGPL